MTTMGSAMHSFFYPNRIRVTVSHSDEVVTKQNMAAECDINNILSQFKRTGIINHIANQPPVYGDLPDDLDFQQSQNTIIAAEAAFDALPSVVRRYFDNDPSKLLEALHNPDMEDKLTELGILNPKPTPRPAGNPANQTISPGPAPPTLEPKAS